MLQAYTSTPSGVAVTANTPINLVTNKTVRDALLHIPRVLIVYI